MSKSVKIFWRIFFGGLGVFVLLILVINLGWLGSMPDLEDIADDVAEFAHLFGGQAGNVDGLF